MCKKNYKNPPQNKLLRNIYTKKRYDDVYMLTDDSHFYHQNYNSNIDGHLYREVRLP